MEAQLGEAKRLWTSDERMKLVKLGWNYFHPLAPSFTINRCVIYKSNRVSRPPIGRRRGHPRVAIAVVLKDLHRGMAKVAWKSESAEEGAKKYGEDE